MNDNCPVKECPHREHNCSPLQSPCWHHRKLIDESNKRKMTFVEMRNGLLEGKEFKRDGAGERAIWGEKTLVIIRCGEYCLARFPDIICDSFIAEKTAEHIIPYFPTIEDALAEDWVEV